MSVSVCVSVSVCLSVCGVQAAQAVQAVQAGPGRIGHQRGHRLHSQYVSPRQARHGGTDSHTPRYNRYTYFRVPQSISREPSLEPRMAGDRWMMNPTHSALRRGGLFPPSRSHSHTHTLAPLRLLAPGSVSCRIRHHRPPDAPGNDEGSARCPNDVGTRQDRHRQSNHDHR
ncbi:hypothetical protein GGR50DRAFT_75426 [Xylaria sp. CBS 124048]|nr:hypothetical protein GGR50DRAFT_75426 [Xylaria sp. CBS 124048]